MSVNILDPSLVTSPILASVSDMLYVISVLRGLRRGRRWLDGRFRSRPRFGSRRNPHRVLPSSTFDHFEVLSALPFDERRPRRRLGNPPRAVARSSPPPVVIFPHGLEVEVAAVVSLENDASVASVGLDLGRDSRVADSP